MPLLLEDIGSYLQSIGLGTPGVDLFYGQMPDSPDECIVLSEYAGRPPVYARPGARLDRPGLQVCVRSNTYHAGRLRLQQTQDAIDGLNETTINGTHYLLLMSLQSPECLGKDANGRFEFVQNYAVLMDGK